MARNMLQGRQQGTSLLLVVAILSYVIISLLIFAAIETPEQDTAIFDSNESMQRQRRMSPCLSLKTPSDDTPKLRYDSSDATVMAYATGYDLPVYQKFVGSLRHTGFSGNIILAVSQTLKEGVEEYLIQQNVTFHRSIPTNCTHLNPFLQVGGKGDDVHEHEARTCVHPYPNLKARWSRFPLLRDYLVDCKDCTGPVLVTDVRDVFFQRDPFGDGVQQVEGLQVFQEDVSQTTHHKLVQRPVQRCKNMSLGKQPMLCSGTTIGTRQAMIQYLTIMEAEMKQWMKDRKCCCNELNGDDQSIHNYLFYTNRLPFATSIPNRMGIVNTVGVQGAKIWNAHLTSKMGMLGVNRQEAVAMPMDGSDPNGNHWLGDHFGLIDNEVSLFVWLVGCTVE